MKRLVLIVVALVFAFCTTVMAADKAVAPVAKDEAVKTDKAVDAKKDVKKVKKVKKADKKDDKKVVEPAATVPAAK